MASPIEFCTLGMFIIDEIEFAPPKPPAKDIVGGAGSYSALGARIFSPPPQSKSIGWIVDCGSDFPAELRKFVAAWDTGVVFRETPDRLTTRGWNGYGEDEHRAFKYLTPKLRVNHRDVVDTPLLWSRSFHLICAPARCVELVENILALRAQSSNTESHQRPLFIWEPVPDLCTPDELPNCLQALKHVDVISPNHQELGGFFGGMDRVNHRLIEKLCKQWLESGIGSDGQGGVVIRCGKEGCYVARPGLQKWLPAYHQSSEKVVDPTGGGNGFLGGLAVGLVRSGGLQNLDEAAIWGSISASFAIEQVGMPVLGHSLQGETWNGVRVEDRVEEFRKRLGSYVQP
ncbi:PfkB family carbohydrate kinase-like protein [Dothidotthia symphoricarpi CBS 119687]|uniref:PfkB family carbohydrate kinase-like protein n=1 Tax=Dothidotthia symphoricarpi CBS 119687 TaxID=1392245 RepID=A0A6A6A8V8_9PLEO|nr:PfkB family carbohydrate kinase-like protein [Dothidotthia symphoricarpi CBS 119687]KAF2127613.1 PfkB family carbohydrate kinase-like protein [Dothidotthia symphoricarpi CBS 119687]